MWPTLAHIATFLLDAVDEARLREVHALETALRAWRRSIDTSLSRARIVISCRLSAWLYHSDPATIAQALDVPGKGVRATHCWHSNSMSS
jgi:hypothetical protein